jgi:SAM-dependent methyltransferase
MKQSEVFLHGEAIEWFARNQDRLPLTDDPVIQAIETNSLVPGRSLEVGCSNGWRVKLMRQKWGVEAYGIDPFFAHHHNAWGCRRGTADDLKAFADNMFDMVIYGWCLYLCDREDLFRIVAEGDRVLKDNGHIVIYDFNQFAPYKTKYKHYDGLYSYKMDYSQLWLANPGYQLMRRYIYNSGDEQTSVAIIRRDVEKGWPEHG